MPLEFFVPRCAQCRAFQVQQAKKTNKWECRVCGLKQSLLKEYGRGSAADCRTHVQKLNAMRGRDEEEERTSKAEASVAAVESLHSLDDYGSGPTVCEPTGTTQASNLSSASGSKWAKYLSQSSDECAQPTAWLKSGLSRSSSSSLMEPYSIPRVPSYTSSPTRGAMSGRTNGTSVGSTSRQQSYPAVNQKGAVSVVHDLSDLCEDDDFEF